MSKFTDITILLDRSGSMNSCRSAAVKGINDFIQTVNADPGEGHWTFLQFDDRDHARGAGEEFPNTIFSHLREYEVPLVEEKDFIPRGGTALVDAVCATVHKIKDWHLSLPKEGQPRVLIVIVTDGQENSSREYTTEQMRELLGEVQEKYGFRLIYLGANQDSFQTARDYGITAPVLTSPAPSWLNQLTGGCLVGQEAPAMNYSSTPQGTSECLMRTSHVTRAWKAEGNESASDLLSSAQPDLLKDKGKDIVT